MFVLLIVNTQSINAQPYSYQQAVNKQLNDVRIAMNAQGYLQSHDNIISSLYTGQKNTFDIRLREGKRYRIVGASDVDCQSMSIEVYDENRQLVGVHVNDKDLFVEIQPRWTGMFQIKVIMGPCVNAPCYFGIATFGRTVYNTKTIYRD